MAVLIAIFGFLEAIAWPLVVGIALIMFREPDITPVPFYYNVSAYTWYSMCSVPGDMRQC